MRTAALLVVVLAGLMVTPAFGRTSASHDKWVANANSACGWADGKRRALPPFDGSTTQLARLLPKIRALQIVELRRIRAVPPAAADRMDVQTLFRDWNSDIAAERTAYLALRVHHYAAFNRAYNSVLRLERAEDALLAKLGTDCRQA